MTYTHGLDLQALLFAVLSGDAAVTAEVGGAIHDAAPATPPAGPYVLIGPEEARDRSDTTGRLTRHDVTISVISDAPGFATAKRAAAAISAALADPLPSLGAGHLVSLRFLRARASRDATGDGRRIDLIFRALIDGA